MDSSNPKLPSAPATPADATPATSAVARGNNSVTTAATAAQSADSTYDTPLAGLVLSASGVVIANPRHAREYRGSLTSRTTLNGQLDTTSKVIRYFVGLPSGRGYQRRWPAGVPRTSCNIPVGAEIQTMVQQVSRRTSAMPTAWAGFDLAGVVERLMCGLAVYASLGQLTAQELRGGGNANIAAVGNTIHPIAANRGSVFVSVRTADRHRPHVLAALVNAISGEGGTMYTDLLQIDGAGVAQVPDAAGYDLAMGCYDALLTLGSMYQQCGQGGVFAYAVARGVHKKLSVHGHTDEGAYVRDVLRTNAFDVPYGPVLLDLTAYVGLPRPAGNLASFQALVDSIALSTAGAVALADPMVNFDGREFPTIFTSRVGALGDPGIHVDAAQADATDIAAQYATGCGTWCKYWVQAISEILDIPGGGGAAVGHLVSCFTELSGRYSRHLEYKSVVAWTWVEPTVACPIGDARYPAFAANHGPLCTRSRSRAVQSLVGSTLEEAMSDSTRSSVLLDMRFLRRHGLFVHLTGHRLDGMAAIRLFSGVADNFAHVGGAGAMPARVLAGQGLDTFQWGRGHSGVVAGGEFIDLNCLTRLVFFHNIMDLANLREEPQHVPTAPEILDGEVVYACSGLHHANVVVPQLAQARNVVRARSRAAASLAMVNASATRAVAAMGAELVPMQSDPGAGSGAFRAGMGDRVLIDGRAISGPEPGATARLPANQATGGDGFGPRRDGRGPIVPLVIGNVMDKGRRAPRPQLAGGFGGGAGGGGGGRGGGLGQGGRGGGGGPGGGGGGPGGGGRGGGGGAGAHAPGAGAQPGVLPPGAGPGGMGGGFSSGASGAFGAGSSKATPLLQQVFKPPTATSTGHMTPETFRNGSSPATSSGMSSGSLGSGSLRTAPAEPVESATKVRPVTKSVPDQFEDTSRLITEIERAAKAAEDAAALGGGSPGAGAGTGGPGGSARAPSPCDGTQSEGGRPSRNPPAVAWGPGSSAPSDTTSEELSK